MNNKLTMEEAKEIIDLRYKGMKQKELMTRFKVSLSCVQKLLAGKLWLQLPRPLDLIVNKTNKLANLCLLTDYQMSIIIGSLLGDGSVSRYSDTGGNSRFTKHMKIESVEYLLWMKDALQPYSCSKITTSHQTERMIKNSYIKSSVGCHYSICSHSKFTELRKKWYQIINGRALKIVPVDLVLDAVMVAIWFCDDGINCSKQRNAIFCTDGFRVDDVKNLVVKLKELGIISKVFFHSNGKPRIRIPAAFYDDFISLIKPHVVGSCFTYKIKSAQEVTV